MAREKFTLQEDTNMTVAAAAAAASAIPNAKRIVVLTRVSCRLLERTFNFPREVGRGEACLRQHMEGRMVAAAGVRLHFEFLVDAE